MASHSSIGPSVSSGMLPSTGSNQRIGLAGVGQKNNLRLSSSVQDFSRINMLDPEEGNILTHSKLPDALERENSGSSFSKERNLPSASFVRKKWVRVSMGLLCIALLFFFIYVFARHFSTNASQFHVILDCGSTGTRVYVYEWSIGHETGHKNLPIVLRSLPEDLPKKPNSRSGRAYHRVETEPGFDKLVGNISGLRTVIKPLLQWAEKQIPKNAHKNTWLFLYATAGVRRLPNYDSEWLLDKAWLILKNSSFLCQRQWVKIITGMEEAYYGWIALNYRTHMLGSSPTFGALDLGGSSLQVTFENDQLVLDDTSLDLTIGAVSHHLSAYSLSGYGLNDAFDKSVVHLLKKLHVRTKADGKMELKHPCLLTGYKAQYICSQCAALDQQGSPLMGGSYINNGRSRPLIELHGAPQWEECVTLAKIAVNLSEWSQFNPGIDCQLQPCALREDLPQPNGQFYAMSGFFVVFRFFNLTSDATLDDVLQKGQEFCNSTWEAAKNSVIPQPFIEQYCFRAPYIVSLLRDGLHITDSQVVIGSGNLTWTLGVALLEAGHALWSRMEINSYKKLYAKLSPTILIGLLFVSLITVVCVLSCMGNWMQRFFHGRYLPVFKRKNSNTTSLFNIPYPIRLLRWSPIGSGEGRVKTSSSTIISRPQQRPSGMGHGLGGSSIQLTMSSLTPNVLHSYSAGNLGQMQFDNRPGSFWSTLRSQVTLQSRRSQSRDDLSSSLTEVHPSKVWHYESSSP
ncbi:probable apyrase 7 [Magnolia sinica]|uniref:probable apyrase 7 n=1 Tax=Magnolia sinica TaxID=86752 RepID=UPI00265B1167|nr:probable apyrase 7 [Magnolia sinica]